MTIDEHIERVQRFVAEGWGFVASEHAVALVDEVRRLREALRATLPYLERAAEELPMYGNFPGGDPRHFTPDPEASTEEERAAWKAACDGVEKILQAWGKGEPPVISADPACEWVRRGDLPEGVASALEKAAEKRGGAPGNPDDLVKVTRAMFGLGSYVVRDKEAAALLEKVRALLGVGA
jgi:hypothetical protein